MWVCCSTWNIDFQGCNFVRKLISCGHQYFWIYCCSRGADLWPNDEDCHFFLTGDSAFQSYVVDRILWTIPFLPYRDPNTFWKWYWNWNLNTMRFVSVIRQPNHIIWEYDDWCLHLGHSWILKWYINIDTHQLLPRSLTWNLKITPWKRRFLLETHHFQVPC